MSGTSKNIEKAGLKLFPDNAQERADFLAAIAEGAAEGKAAIVLDERVKETLPSQEGCSWHPPWIVRLADTTQVGKLPLHEAGKIYALDYSSVFAASLLQEVSLPEVRYVFDLCASPGGKGIFAWKLFSPHLLISNEVVNKRLPPLISNLKRCNIRPAYVTSKDPAFFSEHFSGTGSVVLVDAPCSGQSLLAKGEGESGAFHPATINMNANRQKRIISHAASLVSPGGYLSYMTCTFSVEENEKVLSWFLKRNPNFSPVASNAMQEFRSLYTDIPCYRLWPQSGIGAGSFTALFRKDGEYFPERYESVHSITPVYRLSSEETTAVEER